MRRGPSGPRLILRSAHLQRTCSFSCVMQIFCAQNRVLESDREINSVKEKF